MLTSILLPTMNRHDLLLNALKSLINNTQGHALEVILVVDCDWRSVMDAHDLLRQHGIQHLLDYSPTPRGAINGWNLALSKSHGEMLFDAGDDALFYPKWLDYALAAHERLGGYGMVGLNDLMHPQGSFSTTNIWDRKFTIEVLGGVAAFPCYRYYNVDCELVERAKRAGKWVSCPESIVEHVHAANNKRPVDDTDRSHMDAFVEDNALWERRKNMPAFPNDFEAILK